MKSPVVSIIIPCFNGEKFVGEAIQSALDQTYPHKEVIVIDDGSTDDSLGVIKSFGDCIHWETGPNRGGCAARNRGVELAKGEFIQFLDADDILYPQKIERQLAVMEGLSETLVFCDAESDSVPHPHHVRKDSTDDPVIFMLRGGLQTSAPLHRRDWLNEVSGFREDLPCSQERDLHLRIAALGVRFQRLPEVLYLVRRRPESVSSNFEKVVDQFSGIAWPIYHELEESGHLTELRRREFAAFLARAARAYVRLGRHDTAQDHFQQARQMHPEGGREGAYGSTTRLLLNLLGTTKTEWLMEMKRKLISKW